MLDEQLKLAARLVEPYARAHQHFLPVAGGEPTRGISLPEHGAAHLGAGVLHREIPVSGARPRKIGDLALEPDRAEAALEERPDLAVEPRNAVNIAPDARGRLRCDLHAEMIAVYRFGRARYNVP